MELLVVVAIIGILIALLLPAIQAAREAARRAACKNNLNNLVKALLNYHEAQGRFPPSSTWDYRTDGDGIIDNWSSGKVRENWVIKILPFLELEGTYEEFDLEVPISAPINLAPRASRIEVMLCPEDGYTSTPFNPSQGSAGITALGDGWGRGNYAANAALGFMGYDAHGSDDCAPWSTTKNWYKNWYRGVMGANKALSIEEIKDGSSHTILVAEVRAGLTEFDPRGVWALGVGGASSLWAHGREINGGAAGPNPAGFADGIMGCANIAAAYAGGDQTVLASLGMGCHDDATNGQAGSRSLHDGGIQAAFADGSVHFIGDFIDTRRSGNRDDNDPNSANYWEPAVWDRLNLSNDGRVVPNDAVED